MTTAIIIAIILLVCTFCILFNLIPMFIALARGHRNAVAITAVNILLGWTFVGWVVALVWSLTDNTTR